MRCFQSRVTDINVTTVNGPSSKYVTALITWDIQNSTVHIDRLTMYELTCHSVSESRRITASLSKETRATHLGGFYLSTSYTCCVSEVYNHYYYTRSLCTVLNTTSGRQNMHIVNNITMSISYSTGTDSTYWYTSTSTDTDSTPAAQASITSNTIEWALGGIIIVLLILLALSVITNMCWLCPGFRKRVLPTK